VEIHKTAGLATAAYALSVMYFLQSSDYEEFFSSCSS
jgi:hypothetical protein